MNIGETDGALMSDVKPVAWLISGIDVRNGDPWRTASLHNAVADYRACEDLRDVTVGLLFSQETVLALQAEIVALRKDAERLDYLANDMQDMTFNGVDVLDFIEEDCDWPKAWRKALDAAIAKEK